jgi:hypothetical protein
MPGWTEAKDGDLVETGQFAIFPWFPPNDVDVSGTRGVAVMERLAAQGGPEPG